MQTMLLRTTVLLHAAILAAVRADSTFSGHLNLPFNRNKWFVPTAAHPEGEWKSRPCVETNVHSNGDGCLYDQWFGASLFVRITRMYKERPGSQSGLVGQWLQDETPNMGSGPWSSIEGGSFSADKLGPSYFPKYMIGASTHMYSSKSDVSGGWGFREKRHSCDYLSRVQLANHVLVPPNHLSFDQSVEGGQLPDVANHPESPGGAKDIYLGTQWAPLPIFGGKYRNPERLPRTGAGGKARARLSWTFSINSEQYSGPLVAYPPEHWTRGTERWFDSEEPGEEDSDVKETLRFAMEKETLLAAKKGEINATSLYPDFPQLEDAAKRGKASLYRSETVGRNGRISSDATPTLREYFQRAEPYHQTYYPEGCPPEYPYAVAWRESNEAIKTWWYCSTLKSDSVYTNGGPTCEREGEYWSKEPQASVDPPPAPSGSNEERAWGGGNDQLQPCPAFEKDRIGCPTVCNGGPDGKGWDDPLKQCRNVDRPVACDSIGCRGCPRCKNLLYTYSNGDPITCSGRHNGKTIKGRNEKAHDLGAWSFAHSGIEHHGSLGGEVLDEPTFSEGGFLKLPKYTLPASEEGEGIVLDVRWYDVSLYNSYVNLFNPNETKNATVAGLQAEEGALKSIKWYYPQGCPADYPYAINWKGKGAWFCYSWDCSDKSDGGTYHCGSAPWRNGIDMVHLCRPPAETPLPSPNVTDSFGKTRASYWPQKWGWPVACDATKKYEAKLTSTTTTSPAYSNYATSPDATFEERYAAIDNAGGGGFTAKGSFGFDAERQAAWTLKSNQELDIHLPYAAVGEARAGENGLETNSLLKWTGVQNGAGSPENVSQYVNGISGQFVSEDSAGIPEALKTSTFPKIMKKPVNYMPHDAQVNSGTTQDWCYDCSEEHETAGRCVRKVSKVTLQDGGIVRYRWYRFRDQPALAQLAAEFPKMYTEAFLDNLQNVMEGLHGKWGDGKQMDTKGDGSTGRSKEFLREPTSRPHKAVRLDPNLIMTPPAGKTVGWVPITLGLQYCDGTDGADGENGDFGIGQPRYGDATTRLFTAHDHGTKTCFQGTGTSTNATCKGTGESGDCTIGADGVPSCECDRGEWSDHEQCGARYVPPSWVRSDVPGCHGCHSAWDSKQGPLEYCTRSSPTFLAPPNPESCPADFEPVGCFRPGARTGRNGLMGIPGPYSAPGCECIHVAGGSTVTAGIVEPRTTMRKLFARSAESSREAYACLITGSCETSSSSICVGTNGANGSPCQNGGFVSGYGNHCGCACVGGYTGVNCEFAPCTNGANGSPCKNGGSASGSGNNCGCACVGGYTGNNCEIAPAPCTNGANGEPCQNGGSASGMNGGTRIWPKPAHSACGCTCVGGYTGGNCASPPTVDTEYSVAHRIVLEGVAAETFNGDPKLVQSFRDAVAKTLDVPASDVIHIQAISARRRYLADDVRCTVEYDIRVVSSAEMNAMQTKVTAKFASSDVFTAHLKSSMVSNQVTSVKPDDVVASTYAPPESAGSKGRTEGDSNEDDGTVRIAVGVVVGVMFVGTIAGGYYVITMQRKRKKKERTTSNKKTRKKEQGDATAQEVVVGVELAPILTGQPDAYREEPGSLLAL